MNQVFNFCVFVFSQFCLAWPTIKLVVAVLIVMAAQVWLILVANTKDVVLRWECIIIAEYLIIAISMTISKHIEELFFKKYAQYSISVPHAEAAFSQARNMRLFIASIGAFLIGTSIMLIIDFGAGLLMVPNIIVGVAIIGYSVYETLHDLNKIRSAPDFLKA